MKTLPPFPIHSPHLIPSATTFSSNVSDSLMRFSIRKHHCRYLHSFSWQSALPLPKHARLPSPSCFLWIMGEITSTKHGLHNDELISSGPQEIKESFCHSFPHLTHFTRNRFMFHSIHPFHHLCPAVLKTSKAHALSIPPYDVTVQVLWH